MMEVLIPVRTELRDHILRKEWERHVAKIKATPTNDVQARYDQMGDVGRILKELFLRENKARVRAFENPHIARFLKKFISIAKTRAGEMGYRYEDIELSKDSGITADGKLLVKFVPKPDAERIG